MTKEYKDPLLSTSLLTLTIGSLKVDIENDSDRRLFQDLLRDDDQFREALHRAVHSGSPPQQAVAEFLAQAKAAARPASPLNPVLLRDAIELWATTRGKLDLNRRSTIGEKRRTLELLLAHLLAKGFDNETLSVHEVGRPQLLAFVAAYANRRGKALASKPTGAENSAAAHNENERRNDRESNGDEEGLSARTVVKALGHVSNFFVYAVAQNWIVSNPVDADLLKATEGLRKGASQDRRTNSYEMFSVPELRRIFEPHSYLAHLNAADDFWVPLLGLYLGARLGELAVLEVDSIRFDDAEGVFIVEIKERVEGTRATKNKNSIRKVPVPDELIDLGFLDYVAHVKDTLGAKQLFPNRPMNETRRNDPSKHVSRVFGEYLDEIGITEPTKVFHSLRHTVVTYLHVNGVPVGDAELVCGHASQDAHARLGAVQGSSGTSQTHIKTYVNAAQYSTAHVGLYQRLKSHMDHALTYGLDIAGLRAAARIVLENTVRREDGSIASGWHTNAKRRAKGMLERLAKDRAVAAEADSTETTNKNEDVAP